MTMLGIIFLVLSALIASGNIGGCIAAHHRKRKGIPGGYSNVPLFSLLFSTLAWLLARKTLGAWSFLPAIVDPGTLMTIIAPWILFNEFWKQKK